MLKLILGMATALLLSFSALAADFEPIPLHLSTENLQTQRDQYYRYNFGTTSLHFPVYQEFNLNNDGPGDLLIYQIAIRAGEFSATHYCPHVLPPRSYCTIRVRFAPRREGFHTSRMYIDTSGGLITMDFSGWGRGR